MIKLQNRSEMFPLSGRLKQKSSSVVTIGSEVIDQQNDKEEMKQRESIKKRRVLSLKKSESVDNRRELPKIFRETKKFKLAANLLKGISSSEKNSKEMRKK